MVSVYSMSAVQTFKRCSKKYEIQYKKLLDGTRESPALETGRSFHKIMENYAKTGEEIDATDKDSIEYIAAQYVAHRGFPDRENIISAEEPIYVKILNDVYIRCTMDLVYRGLNTTIVDYKTFSRAPSLDTDLDFQTRIYLALAMKYYKTENVKFRHEYVRTTPPNVPKDKAGNCWSPEECYMSTETVIGSREAKVILEELRYDLAILQMSEEGGMYSRNNIKGGGYMDCSNCSVKELCKAELQHGSLDLIDLTYLAVSREPIEIPEGLA